jgi:branched-chain amino acid transport system ATP-binding protein
VSTAEPNATTDHVTPEPLVRIRNLRVEFAGVHAINDLNLDIAERSVCGLIGPNGAGKTTLFNCITRTVRPSTGTITFAGTSLLAHRASDLASLGIRRTFQNLALFPGMDVRTNVMTGAHSQGRVGWARAATRFGVRSEEQRLGRAADDALELMGLQHVAHHKVTELPFGTLKRVELARAIVSRPRLLLLDEPANGLRESEVDELAEIIRTIRAELDLTMVLVEHHVGLVMQLSDSVAAMASGSLITHGQPQDVRAHPDVMRVFLGETV